jgi:hypothetical protein
MDVPNIPLLLICRNPHQPDYLNNKQVSLPGSEIYHFVLPLSERL